MKRLNLILAALALLLIPAAASADDFSAQLTGGGEGFASVSIDGSAIAYGVVTNLQNPTGASLTGPGVSLNLGGGFVGGSTSGNLADGSAAQAIEGNPGAYTVTVTSGSGNVSGTLQLARATDDDEPEPEPEPETCPQEACVADSDTLCLTAGRFAVEATFVDPADGETKDAQVVNLTPDTGYFYFFGENNVELVTKVLDACTLFDRFFVFAGGLTGETVEITVCDTQSGQLNVYDNPGGGEPFESVVDTAAFLTCP